MCIDGQTVSELGQERTDGQSMMSGGGHILVLFSLISAATES